MRLALITSREAPTHTHTHLKVEVLRLQSHPYHLCVVMISLQQLELA